MNRGGFDGGDRWGGWGFALGNGSGFPGRSDGGGGGAGGELLLSLQPEMIRLIGGKTGCFPEQISQALQRFQRDDGGGRVHRRWLANQRVGAGDGGAAGAQGRMESSKSAMTPVRVVCVASELPSLLAFGSPWSQAFTRVLKPP